MRLLSQIRSGKGHAELKTLLALQTCKNLEVPNRFWVKLLELRCCDL